MKEDSLFTTRRIVLTGLLAALTVAGSAIRIKVPVDIVGTSAFHLGNILCALSGLLLGPWLGGLAAGLGSMIYDLFDPMYISECWITFLTKGAYGLVTGLIAYSGGKHWGYGKALLATVAGAVTYALLYLAKCLFWSGMLMHGLPLEGALVSTSLKLPATAFNALVAIIGGPLLAMAIQKALKRSRLSLE